MNTDLGITCHAWNGNRSQIVVATNGYLLEVYSVKGEAWEKQHTLKEHHQLVSAVDWHPVTNRIISSSHDRNVVVWEFTTSWKPALVNFYQSRGVLDASWSPRGDKFVVGTGSKNIGVGHWSDILHGWNTKRMKLFSSSVTCVRFDPSGLVIGAGSTDNTCKVITAYMEEVDVNTGNFKYSGVRSFGETLYTIATGAWVNSLSWSFDSNWISVTSHNGTVIFSNLTSNQTIVWNGKPFMALQFVKDDQAIAAGFDFKPVLFKRNGEQWSEPTEMQGEEEKATSSVQSRVKMIAQGLDGKKGRETMTTKHKNTITCIRTVDAQRFSTSDISGSLFIWKI